MGLANCQKNMIEEPDRKTLIKKEEIKFAVKTVYQGADI